MVQRLADAGVRVWLSVDIPVANTLSPRHALAENPTQPTWGTLDNQTHNAVRQRTLTLFESIAETRPVYILDPTDAFCSEASGCVSGHENTAYYRDGSHLTSAGAQRARTVYAKVFGMSDGE